MSRFDLHLLPRSAEAPGLQRAAIRTEGELPEYGQIWVWDMLYAQQLFALGEDPLTDELRETLDLWSVNMSSKVFQPQEHVRSKGHLQLSEDLVLEADPSEGDTSEGESGSSASTPDSTPSGSMPPDLTNPDLTRAAGQRITLEVEGAAGELPRIRVTPDILPAPARVALVLAIGQHFIDHNDLFARELPIHLFAFRKYHADIHPPHTAEAAEAAPFYAIQKALEYFQSASDGVG